jgi:hypothetical protein
VSGESLNDFIALVEKVNKQKVVKHDAHVCAWVAYQNRPWTLSNYLAAVIVKLCGGVDRVIKFLK